MAKCEHCGKEVELPFECNYCGHYFCAEHRLPENHNCPNQPPRTPLGSWQTRKETAYAHAKKETGEFASEGDYHFIKETSKSGKPKTRGVQINYKILRLPVKIGLAIFLILLFEYFFLKAYFNNTIYILVALGTIYLIYKLFIVASKIRVTSDLRLWSLRILSGLVFIIGALLLVSVFMSYIALAVAPENLDNPAFIGVFVFFGILGLGLIFLSSYLMFRFMLKSGVIVYPR